ncbi:Transcription factor TFIIIB component B'' [Yarrowia sp. C11]|nr:Transcription factor TFIIIB component B'' [Yarrowia sp. C11]KAG5370784.1 Transcription factor TFIIIB component B'' [Yarrowia sp. E02]
MSSVVKKGTKRFVPKVQPRTGRRRLSSVTQKPSAAATKQLKEAASKLVSNEEAIVEEDVSLPATPQASQSTPVAEATPDSPVVAAQQPSPAQRLLPRPRARIAASLAERPPSLTARLETQKELSEVASGLASPPASQVTEETTISATITTSTTTTHVVRSGFAVANRPSVVTRGKRNAEEISGSSSLRSTQRGEDDEAVASSSTSRGVTTDVLELRDGDSEYEDEGDEPEEPITHISVAGRARKGPSDPILPPRRLPDRKTKVFDAETLYLVSGRSKPSIFIDNPQEWTLDPESVTMAQLCSDVRMGKSCEENDIAVRHKAALERRRDNYRRAKKWVEENRTGEPNLRCNLDMAGNPLPIPSLEEALAYNANYVRPNEGVRDDGFEYIKAEGIAMDMAALFDENDEEQAKKKGAKPKSELRAKQDMAVKALDSVPNRRRKPDLKIKGGVFVVDQSSTVVDRHEHVEAGRDQREVEEIVTDFSKPTTSVTHRRNEKSARWSAEETTRFFVKLSEWGSDFNLISQFFPGRTRRQIKNKFKLEERNNPTKIHLALARKLDISIDQYKTKEGSSVMDTAKEVERKLEKIRAEHAERMKREETAKAAAKKADRAQALEKEKRIVSGHDKKLTRGQRAKKMRAQEEVIGELPVKPERR